jgi:hypothetical protein
MVAGDKNDAFTSAVVEFLDRHRDQVPAPGPTHLKRASP